MDVKEEKLLGKDIAGHWYYVSKGRALRQMLDGRHVEKVLDVGAGSGIFSRQLLDCDVCSNAVCVDPAYRREYDETYHGKLIHFRRSVEKVDQHLVLMMDVLEHVDDDVGLLRMYSGRMPRGGQVLITVPAFQALWSGHDDFLEHRRRYTLQLLVSRVRESGLHVLRCRYYFGLILPAAAALRWHNRKRCDAGAEEARSQLRGYPPLINRALTVVHDIERVALFPFNKLGGLSVFCLAGKR